MSIYVVTKEFLNCAFYFTDLKKTLAVLLDNILQRIGKLESKVDTLVINGTGTNSTNSTTAVPSLVALEKINVAGKKGDSISWHGSDLDLNWEKNKEAQWFFSI